MDGGVLIASGAAAAVVLYVVYAYNRLVERRNHALEAWSGIDVQLKRRHDLLPKLVETVRAYARYEQQVLEHTTELRATRGPSAGLGQSENAITGALRRLFALAEAYPDLKANAGFIELQDQITAVEEQIQYARRYFNGTVRELNILVESFPSNLVARLFGYSLMDYFEIELATQRESPQITLS